MSCPSCASCPLCTQRKSLHSLLDPSKPMVPTELPPLAARRRSDASAAEERTDPSTGISCALKPRRCISLNTSTEPPRCSPTAASTTPPARSKRATALASIGATPSKYSTSANNTTSQEQTSASSTPSSQAKRCARQAPGETPLQARTRRAAQTLMGERSVARTAAAPRMDATTLGSAAEPQPSSMTLRPWRSSAGAWASQAASSRPPHQAAYPVESIVESLKPESTDEWLDEDPARRARSSTSGRKLSSTVDNCA
mmetsp:Transcript_80445/g.211225  ORF Transcript_80445/g.211225 Transcript_80445/m.211225 type:complete len:256 (+) Transcript_80445:88-855(+)